METSIAFKSLGAIFVLAIGYGFGSEGGALAQVPEKSQAPGYEDARAAIWALEQSIYAMRAEGSMAVITNNQSPFSRGWPTISQAYKSRAIKKPFTDVKGPNSLKGDKERVELTFLDMAFDGDTAVMMYKTHKTQMSDGAPADDYFEVTHVWSKEGGKWRLLSGRPQPVSPPTP